MSMIPAATASFFTCHHLHGRRDEPLIARSGGLVHNARHVSNIELLAETRKKAHASFELCLVDRAIPSELYGLLPKRLCLLGNEPHLALEAQQRMRRRVRFLLLRGTVICRL